MEPLRPLTPGLLTDPQRQTILDIVTAMIEADFVPPTIIALRGQWIERLVADFGADGWPSLFTEIRRWVYWTTDTGYWLANVFERATRVGAPWLRGLALLLWSQAREAVGDDAAAQGSCENAYAMFVTGWPDLTTRPAMVSEQLAQVVNRLEIYHSFYRQAASPGAVDEHSALLFAPYHLRTWSTLQLTFSTSIGATPGQAPIAELQAALTRCSGPEWDYFRPIVQRFLAHRLWAENRAEEASAQLEQALADAGRYGGGSPRDPAVVRLDAEIGHLLRLQVAVLIDLRRWSEAEAAAVAAVAHEGFSESAYWLALSAKQLGTVRLLRGAPERASDAFAAGRSAFDRTMMMTSLPIARVAKQQVVRRYTEAGIAAAQLAGNPQGMLAEIESAAPVSPSEELGSLLAAHADPALDDFQAARATFYEHLTTVPERFTDYLDDVPSQRQTRQAYSSLWEHSRSYVVAKQLACSSDLAVQRLTDDAVPGRVAVFLHSGRTGTDVVAVSLDGSGRSQLVQAGWGERELLALQRRFSDDLAAATSPTGRAGAIATLLETAEALLGPALTELLPLLAGAEVMFFPRAQLAAVPLHALRVHGQPLIEHCDIAYGTTVRQLTFPREMFGSGEPGNDLTVVHDAAGTRYLRGAVTALEEAFGTRAEVVSDPDVDSALAALARVDGDLVLACHGVFDADDPGAGRLEFGAPPGLTFGDFFASVTLPACRVIVLAACASNVSRSTVASELIGLPALLLAAGARYVVGSAWEVNELAASVLVGDYGARLARGEAPVAALNAAQRSLRQLSLADLQAWCRARLGEAAEKLVPALAVLGERPFAAPQHWAAFAVTGGF